VLQAAGGVTLDEAIEQVLGVTPRALAAGILEQWHFPPAYSAFFRAPEPTGHLQRAAAETKLFAVVGLAADYARDPAETGAEVRTRWSALFESSGDVFADATRVARRAWTEHARALGLAGIPQPAAIAAPSAASAQPGDASATPADAAATPADAATTTARGDVVMTGAAGDPLPPLPSSPTPEAESMPDAHASLAIVAEITRAMLEQADLNDVLAMVLEGIARCGPFDVVFLALLDTSRTHLLGRLGYGDHVRSALRGLNVALGPDAGPLAHAVMSSRGQIVGSGSPGTQFPAVRSFVVEPLVVRSRAIGVIVGGRTRGADVGPAEQDTLRVFCTQAALALDRAAR
jgi:hypothetical protein